MILPELQAGTLVRRYKRFLADITDARGKLLTIHCPNTGAMTGCVDPGNKVYYSRSTMPSANILTLEFIESPHGLVGVNTGHTNRLIEDALRSGVITELGQWPAADSGRRAAPSGAGRFDFLLSQGTEQIFVEVKSVTLRRSWAWCISRRCKYSNMKHVEELQLQLRRGARGVLLFCVQHLGIERVSAAADIDPKYAEACARRQKTASRFWLVRVRRTYAPCRWSPSP